MVLSGTALEQLHHAALVSQVEGQQRLVTEEHGRVGGQGVRHSETLLLAARELTHGHVRVRRRADLVQQVVDEPVPRA